MSDASVRGRVIICNQRGLHARAAAKFVKLAGAFNAEVTVRANGSEVPGSSIMGLMMLAAAIGCDLEIMATGPDAMAAMESLVALVEHGFDED